MNCSARELVEPEPDSGSIFVTRSADKITIRVRGPHARSESEVTLSFKDWKKIALPKDTVGA
jgi:hypothetical protein